MDHTKIILPEYDDLPDIPLYIDQVIKYINVVLADATGPNAGDILTRSMINNYVKDELIPAPEGKFYTRTHIAYLLIIAAMKQVFSMPEIDQLFSIQKNTYDVKTAYNYIVSELHHAMKFEFLNPDGALPYHATHETEQTKLVRAMVLSFASKVYVQSQLSDS